MTQKLITLICERSCDLSKVTGSDGQLLEVPGCYVIKFPCSGMIQPLMIEAALKNGADGVVVTGCQIGDCYYREGNRMLRERLRGERPPGLKKNVDRQRVIGLWLSKVQPQKFVAEVKEFSSFIAALTPAAPAAKPAAPVTQTPEPKPAEPKPVSAPSDAAAADQKVKVDDPKAEVSTPAEKAEVKIEPAAAPVQENTPENKGQ